jgi:hypothetical protein
LVALIIDYIRIAKARNPDAYARTTARNYARKIIVKEKRRPETTLSEFFMLLIPRQGKTASLKRLLAFCRAKVFKLGFVPAFFKSSMRL